MLENIDNINIEIMNYFILFYYRSLSLNIPNIGLIQNGIPIIISIKLIYLVDN